LFAKARQALRKILKTAETIIKSSSTNPVINKATLHPGMGKVIRHPRSASGSAAAKNNATRRLIAQRRAAAHDQSFRKPTELAGEALDG